MENIKSISMSVVLDKAIMSALNCDENGVQKRVVSQNKDFISGNKIRYSILASMAQLNEEDENSSNTFFSFGDGRGKNIATDVASDFAGFMNPSKDSYADKRVSPMMVSNSISLVECDSQANLWTKMKNDPNEYEDAQNKKQNINTKYYTSKNVFRINTALNCSKLGVQEFCKYDEGVHIDNIRVSLITAEERKRRVKMFAESLTCLKGFANQARAAIDSTPSYIYAFISKKDLGIFNKDVYSTKAWQDLINHYTKDNNTIFVEGGDGCELTVFEAIDKIINILNEGSFVNDDLEVKTLEEVKELYSTLTMKAAKTKKGKKNTKEEELATEIVAEKS